MAGSKPDQSRSPKRKRERIPHVLEHVEVQLLLSKLDVRERALALLDTGTGLRISDLLALRLRDVDFEKLELNVSRSVWHQVVGDCKTEASAKPVPPDTYLAEDLLRWRRQSSRALMQRQTTTFLHAKR
jgi:integrase